MPATPPPGHPHPPSTTRSGPRRHQRRQPQGRCASPAGGVPFGMRGRLRSVGQRGSAWWDAPGWGTGHVGTGRWGAGTTADRTTVDLRRPGCQQMATGLPQRFAARLAEATSAPGPPQAGTTSQLAFPATPVVPQSFRYQQAAPEGSGLPPGRPTPTGRAPQLAPSPGPGLPPPPGGGPTRVVSRRRTGRAAAGTGGPPRNQQPAHWLFPGQAPRVPTRWWWT